MGYLKKKELIIESRYKVIKKIGIGKYATTYKVKDIRTSNTYVLKIFDKITIEQFYQFFDPESMEKAVSLNFMQITDFIDFGVHKDSIFFIRESFSDASLEKLKFETINLNQFYSILGQILSAITFLDSQNFNATNLKLSNLLYKFKAGGNIHVKLTDYFFIGPDSNRFRVPNNSFYYKAPEIIYGKDEDLISNFYTLGVVLYKITTGVYPYSFNDIKSFIEKKTLKVVKSPTDINNHIPEKLSEFILKLIKLSPEDRFLSIEELVEALNKIQGRDFSYIAKTDLRSYVNYHDYYVDEDISHLLVNHISEIQDETVDNIIVLYGQKGIRKDRTISLFRYHILNENNLIYDYQCSSTNRDPFFSLCVEFFNSGLIDRKEWEEAESKISDRFKEFISKSGIDINKIEDKKEYETDFLYVTKFLMFVARETRPLIFVIRNAEYLQKITIDFLNFLISYKEGKKQFVYSPIMIVLSTNNVNKFLTLNTGSVTYIHSHTMNYEKSESYVMQLLKNTPPPNHIMSKIWYYTHGNPWYIKLLVLELIRKKIIVEEDDAVKFNKLAEIAIPKQILNNINNRLDNLPDEYKNYLVQLCWLGTKFSRDLYYKIISDDYQFIDLMIMNDFLEEVEENHYKVIPDFMYLFLKDVMSFEEKSILSQKFLEYVRKNKITLPYNLLLLHFNYVRDFSIKKIMLDELSTRMIEKNNFYMYFKTIFSTFTMAYESKVPESEVRAIALKLVLNYEYIFFIDVIDQVTNYLSNFDDSFYYKNIIFGLNNFKKNRFSKAMEFFYQAIKTAKNLEEEFVAQLFTFNIINKMENYTLNEIYKILGVKIELNLLKKGVLRKIKSDFYNYYNLKLIRKKILEYLDKNKYNNALNLINTIFEKYQPQTHLELFVFMDYYNFLGIIKSIEKKNKQALDNYAKGLRIAEKYKIFYHIILFKNNSADTYLFMGKPEAAFPLVRDNLKLCGHDICVNVIIQSMVNIAEAFIKMGKFEDALNSLTDAYKISERLENKPFRYEILNNFSLIKIKLKNFNFYLEHIKKYFPKLYKGKITTINPTVKTYFYFLNQVGDYDKIKILIEKNRKVFDNEQEFMHRAKSFLIMEKLRSGNYTESFEKNAFEVLQKTIEFSKNIRSKYAETITLINLAEYYLLLKELDKAQETINGAIEYCLLNKYEYWLHQAKIVKILIDLQKPSIDFRKILSELFANKNYFATNNIFYSEIVSLHLAILITHFMGKKNIAKKYFAEYKLRVINATDNLDGFYKKLFIKKFPLDFDKVIENSNIKIVRRKRKIIEKFSTDVFPLLNNKDPYSRKDKLTEIIKDYLYLEHFSILHTHDGHKPQKYLSYNFDFAVLDDNKLSKKIVSALSRDEIILYNSPNYRFAIIPIAIKYEKFGVMISYEDLATPLLTKADLKDLNIIRIHLAAFFKFEERYFDVIEREENVRKLLDTFEDSILSTDISSLEKKILEKICYLLDAERAFIFKNGEETEFFVPDSNEEKNEHTNIDLILIEKFLKNNKTAFEYINDKTNLSYKNYIFILRLYFPEFDYKAVYYFDSFTKDKPLTTLDNYFIKMLVKIIRTTIAIVHKNIFSTMLKKQIDDFREEKMFFLKLLNHEFNTPLTKILYAVETLKKSDNNKFDNEKENAISILEKSYQKISNLMEMVNKYYFYKEQYKPYFEYKNLKDIIIDVINEIEEKAKKAGRNLYFKTDFSENLPEYLKIDERAIIDILKILLSNSVRFSFENGEIIVGARMALFEKERISKHTLVLFVTDFGKGISPSQSKKIYNMIYEAKDINAHKSGELDYNSGGLGLGLSIAAIIMQKLNGKIEHESEVNKKTTFYVKIPTEIGEEYEE